MLAKLSALDRNRLGIIGIALAIVLFLAVNILSGTLLTSMRLDLTEDRLFTLSDGTRRVLSEIEEPRPCPAKPKRHPGRRPQRPLR